jgi:hypothetical protein
MDIARGCGLCIAAPSGLQLGLSVPFDIPFIWTEVNSHSWAPLTVFINLIGVRDVLNYDFSLIADRVGQSPQQGRYVVLPVALGVGLAELTNRPDLDHRCSIAP